MRKTHYKYNIIIHMSSSSDKETKLDIKVDAGVTFVHEI